jgi:uncharacterized protein YhaN
LHKEGQRLKEARRVIAAMNGLLTDLCREAHCAGPAELKNAEESSLERARIQDELHRLEEQLLKLSAGAALDKFDVEAAGIDPDLLVPQINRLAESIESLSDQSHKLSETIGSERTILEGMRGTAEAASAAEQIQNLLAQVEADVEQYVPLRLASAVLRDAIERYREQNQGPLLCRAGELFARLTAGSFEGLRLDCDEKGDPVLKGVRVGSKALVGVEGMSDGTGDQLYLALRLASLEAYIARNEPLPFILDDILVNFDDVRSTAALQTLGELSKRTQVLFFTHHEHLIRLAEKCLGDGMFCLHRLQIG